MATPAEMRTLATTLEEIAPHVETDYGPGQVATYGLAWEALQSGADEIDRLRTALERLFHRHPALPPLTPKEYEMIRPLISVCEADDG